MRLQFAERRRFLFFTGIVVLLVLVTVGIAWFESQEKTARAAGPFLAGMVADVATNSVIVFDASTDTVLGAVLLPGGPTYVVGDCTITADHTLGFVTDFENRIWVIDLTASPPALATGTNPILSSNPGEDTSISPDQDYLVVSDGGGGTAPISVIDIAARAETSVVATGWDTNSIDVLSDGSVLTTSLGAGNLRRFIISGAGGLTDTGDVLVLGGEPNNVFGAPAARSGVVVERDSALIRSFTIPGLSQVDVRSLSGTFGISGVVHPDGDRVYVRSNGGAVDAFSYNEATGALGATPLFTIAIADAYTFFGMDQLAISADGSKLYVPQPNAVNVYSADSGAALATITHPSIVRPTGLCIASSTAPEPTPTPCPPAGCPTSTDTPTPTPTVAPPVKGNDDFASTVAILEPLPYSNQEDTSGATREPGEPQPCAGIGATAWFSFTPSADVVVTADTIGSNFDTALAAYAGTSLGSLIPLACDDDGGPGLLSQVSFVASAGATYQFQVGGFLSSAGNLIFNVVSKGTPTPTATATPTHTFTPTVTPTPGGPEMIMTVKSGGSCAAQACQVDVGADFILSVEIVVAPPAGYILAQSWVDYGTDLEYKPAVDPSDEIVWPDCLDLAALRAELVEGAVSHTCLSGFFPPQLISNHVGNYVDLAFTCSQGSSSTEVKLLPYLDPIALTNGARFVEGDNVTQTIPRVSNLTINCVAPIPVGGVALDGELAPLGALEAGEQRGRDWGFWIAGALVALVAVVVVSAMVSGRLRSRS